MLRRGAGTEREGEEAHGTTATTRRRLFAPSPGGVEMERGKGGGATTTTTTTTMINRNDNDGGCGFDDGEQRALPPLRRLRDISLERPGSRWICQGKAPVLAQVTLVFFGLLSHTFKIKPTLDYSLVDFTPSFCLP